MDWSALYKTFGLCLISVLIEGISYTKSGKAWFEQLNRPRLSPSIQVWYFVGGLYYLLFGVIVYRQFRLNYNFLTAPILLLTAVMLVNGFSNFIIFKYRALKVFYVMIYPFATIVILLVVMLAYTDIVSSFLAGIYLLWLFYDLYYFYWLWKLNEEK
jgi:tryptophan-rich sensory protein